jgi:large subunit ribosomal protein L7/L12
MSEVVKLLAEVNKLSATEKNELLIEVFKSYNLLAIKEFKDLFCKTFDVSASAPMVASMPVGVAPTAEKPVEPTEFNVMLTGAAADKKINVIKVVRAITNLGLKEARQLVDEAPKPIKEKVSKDEAAKLKKELEEAGATIEIKPV